jgi:segregation and condensation protein A
VASTPVRDLDLDLDAFEGPFDLLLALLLHEELAPRDVDVAAIVLAFAERLAE